MVAIEVVAAPSRYSALAFCDCYEIHLTGGFSLDPFMSSVPRTQQRTSTICGNQTVSKYNTLQVTPSH